MNLISDDSWMKGDPLGRAVEGLRRWGAKPKREREGVPCEPYVMVLYYVPDPVNTPSLRFLVCDGRSYRDGEADRWHDEIHIQVAHGLMQRLGDDELAGVRDRAHWKFARETLAEQREKGSPFAAGT